MRNTSEAGVFVLNAEKIDHAVFSFYLFRSCTAVPKIYLFLITVILKLNKENPIQFWFHNQSTSPLVFIFIEFQS